MTLTIDGSVLFHGSVAAVESTQKLGWIGVDWMWRGESKNGAGARAVIHRAKVNNSPNNTFVLITNFSRSPTASSHSLFLPLTMN